MRVIALLSWYEEPTAWLAECVASAARLCDHIIAVDGPYAAFPGALRKPVSGSAQVDTIVHTAAGAGMGCTVHVPRQPWWGGEVEKRDFMFRLGETMARPGDWYLRIDADETLTSVPSDARDRLEQSVLDVAEVTIWERATVQRAAEVGECSDDFRSPFRCLFRALPGIRIEQTHYMVTVPDGAGRRVLCGDGVVHRPEPAEPLYDVGLEHRTLDRPAGRRRLKQEYQETVLNLGLECPCPFD